MNNAKSYDGMSQELDAIVSDPKTFIQKDIYKGTPADKNRPVDSRNLTEAQLLELNQFAADLVNQFRDQFGKERVKLSEGAMDLAKYVGINSNRKDFHDGVVLSKTDEIFNVFGGECMSTGGRAYNAKTMWDLKAYIYSDMSQMMFQDAHSNWGHTYIMMGIKNNNPMTSGVQGDKNAHFGMAIDRFGNFHYQFLTPKKTTTNDQFNMTEIAIPDNSAKIKELNAKKTQLASEQSKLDSLNNVLASVNSVLDSAKSSQNAADKAIQDAQRKVSDLEQTVQSGKSTLATLKASIEDDNQKLAMAQAKLDHAEKQLGNFNQDTQARLQRLQDAKDKLANLVSEQQKALDAYNDALKAKDVVSSKINTLKDQLKNASDKVTEAENVLNVMKDADKHLTDAKNSYKDAQDKNSAAKEKLANVKANLDDAKEKLQVATEQLKIETDKLDQLQNELDQAKSEWDKLIQDEKDKLEQEKEFAKVENEAKAKDEGYHVNENFEVVDQNDSVKTEQDDQIEVGPTETQLQGVTSRVSARKASYPKDTANLSQTSGHTLIKTDLPQTGDDSKSVFASISLGLISLAGAIGLSRKKRKA